MNEAPEKSPALESALRAYALATAQNGVLFAVIATLAKKDAAVCEAVMEALDHGASEYTDSALGGRNFGPYEREVSRMVAGHVEDMQKALRKAIEG